MGDILIPKDALSHSQMKSKIWLKEKLNTWSDKYLILDKDYTLNWYGSWAGLGPFVYLTHSKLKYLDINLFDIDASSLDTAKEILEFWRCDYSRIHSFCIDINQHKPQPLDYQIFINTSCEHILEYTWLNNIPTGSYILLQSTNMPHAEHINKSHSLDDFKNKYQDSLDILEIEQIDFNYPDKKFSRYMLFGKKL